MTEDQTLFFQFYVLLSSPIVWMIIFLCVVTALIPDIILKVYDKIRERQLLNFFYKKNIIKNDLKTEKIIKLKDKIKKNHVFTTKYKITQF
jgi:hypothetical protein